MGRPEKGLDSSNFRKGFGLMCDFRRSWIGQAFISTSPAALMAPAKWFWVLLGAMPPCGVGWRPRVFGDGILAIYSWQAFGKRRSQVIIAGASHMVETEQLDVMHVRELTHIVDILKTNM